MKVAWQKIENWIKENHPTMLDTLIPGAENSDFQKLEILANVILPSEFKEFYSIHNGQSLTHLNLFDGDRLLDIESIIEDLQSWKSILPELDAECRARFGEPIKSSPDVGIKDDWWNFSWIPITSNGSGDCYCIDLSPTSEGTIGQIIRFWHDIPNRELVAPSFHNWIYDFVRDLENNLYEPSDDLGWGGIVKKE